MEGSNPKKEKNNRFIRIRICSMSRKPYIVKSTHKQFKEIIETTFSGAFESQVV